MVTRALLNKVKDYVDIGVKEGAKLVVDGRNFKLQGYENGNFIGGCLFDDVTPDMRIYKEEIFGPVLSVVRAKDYEEAVRLPSENEYGNGVAIFTRDGDTARDFTSRVQVGMVGVNFAIPGAARLLHLRRLEALRLRRSQPARTGFDPLLHQDQDRDRALAVGHQGRRRVRHSDDEVGYECMQDIRPAFRASALILALLALRLQAAARHRLRLAGMRARLSPPQPQRRRRSIIAGRWMLSSPGRGQCRMTFGAAGPTRPKAPSRRRAAAPAISTRAANGPTTRAALTMRDHNGQPLAQLTGRRQLPGQGHERRAGHAAALTSARRPIHSKIIPDAGHDLLRSPGKPCPNISSIALRSPATPIARR